MKKRCFILLAGLLASLGIAVAAQIATGQKGMRMGGNIEPLPPEAFPCAKLSLLKPEQISNGNCFFGNRGLILCVSDDPKFTSLIKASFNDPEFFCWDTVRHRQSEAQKETANRLKECLPILLRALESKNGCIQKEAIQYLGISQDKRAVGPLLRILENYPKNAMIWSEALLVLAKNFQEPAVIPYFIEVSKDLDNEEYSSYAGVIMDSCTYLPPDKRIFEQMTAYYEKEDRKVGSAIVIQTLAELARKGNFKDELTVFFKRNAHKYDFDYSVVLLARIVASPDTFDDLASIYERDLYDRERYAECRELLSILEKIGGEQFLSFSRRQLQQSSSTAEKTKAADAIIETIKPNIPDKFSSNEDIFSWLARNAGETALKNASQKSISPILQKNPDSLPSSPPDKRLAFWNKASRVFKDNKSVYYWTELQLYKTYISREIDNPEKALEAISLALENYDGKSVPEQWIMWRDNLKDKLNRKRLAGSVKIESLSPEKRGLILGNWNAELVLPEDASKDILKNKPFGYLELFDNQGKIISIPAEINWTSQSDGKAGRIPFTAILQGLERKPVENIAGIRIKLLFVSKGEGFSGVVVSETMTPQ